MPFTLRPYRRFPVQCSVTYNAGNLSCNGWRLSGDLPMRHASVGGGLIWNIPWKDSQFELYYGKQLNRLKLGKDNLQDYGIHLQLVIQAFQEDV